jgi:hypothetical protein
MQIKITKRNNRNQLTCVRKDGSLVKSDLGPKLPFHDIAHFVVEKTLGLQNGFYGNIKNGYTIEQLSDKQIIKTLGHQTWFAEITTRALQSLSSGACTIEQFAELIETEMKQFSFHYPFKFTEELISKMQNDYKKLLELWDAILEGETLVLEFDVEKSK